MSYWGLMRGSKRLKWVFLWVWLESVNSDEFRYSIGRFTCSEADHKCHFLVYMLLSVPCAFFETSHLQEVSPNGHACLPMQEYRLAPSIPCHVGSPGLSLASGFEHPASTLPTRFPVALGIGYGLPAASLLHPQ